MVDAETMKRTLATGIEKNLIQSWVSLEEDGPILSFSDAILNVDVGKFRKGRMVATVVLYFDTALIEIFENPEDITASARGKMKLIMED